MNVYDSSRISVMLDAINYKVTDSFRDADLIIVNTCTIRDKARQKAVSFLGRLASMKRRNPELIIAVGGCVAQHEGRALISKFPFIDIVFGTHAVTRLPGLLRQVKNGQEQVVDITMTDTIDDDPGLIWSGPGPKMVSDFVTIMRGCENFCTYCVVPYVRGVETSRRPERIVEEVHGMVSSGVKEIVLLWQNVNSYGNKEALCTFPELLAIINDIEGLERIRFTTSHPKDLSDELIYAFKTLDKLCNHFHLPVQSGSSRILNKMNRKYTREHYLERVAALRETVPDMAITTDIIVGFPGETLADFEETESLLSEIEFDSIFAFMYSDRPLAPASDFDDKVSEGEKNRRVNRLLELQKGISQKKNSAMVGQVVSVLVEGPSKRASAGDSDSNPEKDQWTGRTTTNKVVNFMLPDNRSAGQTVKPGDIVRVIIDSGFAHSLSGQAIIGGNDSKNTGGSFHAA